MVEIKEGEIAFHVPAAGKPVKTWYKIVGTLGGKPPLIAVHGGPGMTHDYLLPIQALYEKCQRPVIFYDQIGSGRSTHLQEKAGDYGFWTIDLFCDEFVNLLQGLRIAEYDFLGQSWGGMLGSVFASRQPKGLRKLIVSNSPASMVDWVAACDKLRAALPQDVQDTLLEHETAGSYFTKEYKAAVLKFYEKHLCRVLPFPPELKKTFDFLEQDGTVYHTMNGPSEFFVIGSLKNFDSSEAVRKINVPTLLINGRYDEAQDTAVAPYFRNIEKAKWITMENSSHLPMLEEPERYLEILMDFLEN